jgi:uncharacterized protein YprB with RNaseH-like and TPR domain
MPGLADKFSRLAALKPARGTTLRAAVLRAPDEEDSLSRLPGAAIATNHYGEHISVRTWFSSPEFFEPSDLTLELLSRTHDVALSKRTHAALADPTKWLFLDTETTGLGGGTGTYAFLVGLAWWDAGGLQAEQLFMRDFAEEHSILHELAARLAERPVLITFNGKSFDWPLLENRFTLTRAIPTPRLAAHLDLLHPARALWTLRLGSVRLVELERHVLDARRLGWHREDDVVSAMIPEHYFDYLRGGPVGPLAAVVRHNQMDLRGLAALFGKVDMLLASENRRDREVESLDLFGLARFLERRGDSGRAHTACAQALDLGLPAEFRPQARRRLALLAKRRGDHENAALLWRELADESTSSARDSIDAYEQLAIYHEHRLKDFASAAEFAHLALARLRRARANSLDPYTVALAARAEQKFLNRIARLEHRMALSNRRRSLLSLSALPGPSGTTSKFKTEP